MRRPDQIRDHRALRDNYGFGSLGRITYSTATELTVHTAGPCVAQPVCRSAAVTALHYKLACTLRAQVATSLSLAIETQALHLGVTARPETQGSCGKVPKT